MVVVVVVVMVVTMVTVLIMKIMAEVMFVVQTTRGTRPLGWRRNRTAFPANWVGLPEVAFRAAPDLLVRHCVGGFSC